MGRVPSHATMEAHATPRAKRLPATTTAPATPENTADFAAQLLREVRVLSMQASSLAANPVLAEDLVQDTLERALRHQGRFCPGTSLRSWLMRIMRNLFIDRCRERARHCHLPAGDDREIDIVDDEPPVDEPEPIRPWDLLGTAALDAALTGIDERLRHTLD